MEKILLTLRKAEENPESVPLVYKPYDLQDSWVDVKSLARFFYGERVLRKVSWSTYIIRLDETVSNSLNRSLRRLVDFKLVEVLPIKSPGRHGYFYGLTEKGRQVSETIREKVQEYLREYEKFL